MDFRLGCALQWPAPSSSDGLRCYTREALAIEVDQGIKAEQVVDAMTRIAATRAAYTIRVDNGPGLISKAVDGWAYQKGVTLDFSRPGKPTDNAFVEPFNGHPRDATA
jgi:putative transposase